MTSKQEFTINLMVIIVASYLLLSCKMACWPDTFKYEGPLYRDSSVDRGDK